MATGVSSNNHSGPDDGSLVVAQIRTPSTPFESDMNPVADFPFSGREEVVTVKDVENIVKTLSDCFSRFIETQRNYLETQNTTDTEDSSKNESTAAETQPSENTQSSSTASNDASNDSDLTEPAISDIIKSTLDEKNSFLRDDLQNSVNNLGNVIDTKLESISGKITENLLDSEDKNESSKNIANVNENDSKTEATFENSDGSFIDYISKIESNVDEVIEKNLNSITESINNSISIDTETVGVFREENKGILGDVDAAVNDVNLSIQKEDGIDGNDGTSNINDTEDVEESADGNFVIGEMVEGVKGYLDELTDDIKTMFQTETPGEPPVDFVRSGAKDGSELLALFRAESGDIEKKIGGLVDDGVAKSMLEVAAQTSMMQANAAETINGLSTMMYSGFNEKFGDVIQWIQDTQGRPITTESESSSAGTVSNIVENGTPSDMESEVPDDVLHVATMAESMGESDKNASTATSSSNDAENTAMDSYGGIGDFINGAISSVKSLFEKTVGTIKQNSGDDAKQNSNTSLTVVTQSEENNNEASTTAVVTDAPTTANIDLTDDIEDIAAENDDYFESISEMMETANDEMYKYIDRHEDSMDDMLSGFSDGMSLFDNIDKTNDETDVVDDIDEILEQYFDENADVLNGEMASSMAKGAVDDEKNTEASKASAANSGISENEGENNKQTGQDGLMGAVLENRSVAINGFDKIEKLLTNGKSTSATQMIYTNTHDGAYEVERIR